MSQPLRVLALGQVAPWCLIHDMGASEQLILTHQETGANDRGVQYGGLPRWKCLFHSAGSFFF